ncbi:MAG TPA: DUF695 domain-containing protein [Kofleriaceae bacterium]|nr:DUF695 domain-containing protein [Kofleriaceae bacterium]
MSTHDADLWHQVHAQREDGVTAMFLIRDVEPRADQPQIVMIELPYPITDPSKLPDGDSYRRLDTFQEQWVEPACEALGWTFVAWKSEDGSFFLYLYGDGDPNALLEKLAPFDESLEFFHDRDANWSEYAALRDLVDQAQADPDDEGEDSHIHSDDWDHDHDHAHDHDHEHAHDHAHNHNHNHDHGHDHDHDHPSHHILVIDRSGEQPADTARTAKPKTRNTAEARSTAAKSPGTRAARASAAKIMTARSPAAKSPAAKSPAAKSPAAKPRAAKTARPRSTKAKTASAKRTANKAAKPAGNKPAPGKRSSPRMSRR